MRLNLAEGMAKEKRFGEVPLTAKNRHCSCPANVHSNVALEIVDGSART
jgi:hypothetical protein